LSLNLYGYLSNKKKYQKFFFTGSLTSASLLIADFFDLQNLAKSIYLFLMINSFFLFFYSTKFSFIKNKLSLLFFSFSFFFVAMLIDILQNYPSVFLIPYLYSSFTEELFEFLGAFYYTSYWIEVIRKINKLKNQKNLY
jgi:hypothetical protein